MEIFKFLGFLAVPISFWLCIETERCSPKHFAQWTCKVLPKIVVIPKIVGHLVCCHLLQHCQPGLFR